MSTAAQQIKRKRYMLDYARKLGNVRKACRYFGIGRSSFYRWRRAFTRDGDAGLIHKRPIAQHQPNTTPPEIVEQVLHLRRTYHLGPARIVWYLARYHGITISGATVYRTLRISVPRQYLITRGRRT